jgi:hypothetical protein
MTGRRRMRLSADQHCRVSIVVITMKTGIASACMRHIVSALIYNAITIGIVYVFLLWWHGSHDIMVHEKFRRPRCALAGTCRRYTSPVLTN